MLISCRYGSANLKSDILRSFAPVVLLLLVPVRFVPIRNAHLTGSHCLLASDLKKRLNDSRSDKRDFDHCHRGATKAQRTRRELHFLHEIHEILRVSFLLICYAPRFCYFVPMRLRATWLQGEQGNSDSGSQLGPLPICSATTRAEGERLKTLNP